MSSKAQVRELRQRAVLNRICLEAEKAGWKQVKATNGIVRGKKPGTKHLSRYVPSDPLLAEFVGLPVKAPEIA